MHTCRYDNCHRLFLNKVQNFKLSCLISVPIKGLGIRASMTVSFSVRRNFGITVEHLMTLIL